MACVPTGDDLNSPAVHWPFGPILADGETGTYARKWALVWESHVDISVRRAEDELTSVEYVHGYCHCISSFSVFPLHPGYTI